MLDIVKVDVYGQKMPINQLGSITTPEPRSINIQVWDTNNVALIDSAIKKSELGLNPQIDGQLIRLPVPDLSEERRSEIKKISLGKINKFKDENSLMSQDWVMDPKMKVKDVLKNLDISNLQINNFIRLKIGE